MTESQYDATHGTGPLDVTASLNAAAIVANLPNAQPGTAVQYDDDFLPTRPKSLKESALHTAT